MSPLLETIIAVVLAVAVLMVIIFFMRADKESENESFKPEVPPQGEEKELKNKEFPSNHPSRRVNIVFAQPIPTKIHQGKTFEYTILPKCYLAKDGKEYQVLKSSTGAVFYVAENGTRRYLSKKDIETLKDI